MFFCIPILTCLVVLLPCDLLIKRLFTSFFYQSTYSQRATLYEYCTSKFLKFNYKYLDPKTLGAAFNGRSLSKWFLYYRCYRQGFAKLNDSEFKNSEEEGIKGIWITSPCRCANDTDFDLVLFYVHGGGFIQSSPWFYVEFLNVVLVCLQEQGFKNPAIFIVDYQQGNFNDDLRYLSEAWQYVQLKASKAHLVLSGDGSGGLLALALLFHIASPYNFIPIPVIGLQKPSALVLISPWTKMYYEEKSYPGTSEDFINYEVMNKLSKEYIGEEQFIQLREQIEQLKKDDLEKESCDTDDIFDPIIDHYRNPGYCESLDIWQEAFPRYGAYITCGDEEYLRDEITDLAERMSVVGKTKFDPRSNQIHCWPVLTFYTERIEELREDGIEYICGIISRMLLWNTDTFFEQGALVPVKIEYS